MRRKLRAILGLLAVLVATTTNAAHTRVALVLANSTAKPGDTVLAAVRLEMDEHWHTYWKNPGASGAATKIAWKLPEGVVAGDIQWPLPEKLPAGDDDDLTTYVFHDEAVLLVPLRLSMDLKPGPVEIAARVAWLECEKLCVPGNADVAAKLNVGETTTSSDAAAMIAQWQSKLPKPGDSLSAEASWEKAAAGDLRPLILEWNAARTGGEWEFFPFAYDAFDIQPKTEALSSTPETVRLRKMIQKFEGDWPSEIAGVAVQTIAGQRHGFIVSMPIAGAPKTWGSTAAGGDDVVSPPAKAADALAVRKQSLLLMLLYAFVGGLILNIMPCVLPVIALKILGFVNQSRDNPREVRKLGLIYTAGVLVSFLVLAALVIGVKAAGNKAAWGMQFGNPVFVVSLTVLVTLVALNLFGVFEITLSGRVLDATGGLTSKHGAAGAFFNGVLATVLATPCTAPILGFALGFAFAQPPALIVLMFLTVGLGLALPYLLLSWQPAWLKFLPKPGAWMEKFKIAMGFPMLATAVWLFTLTLSFYGKRSLWLGIFLVVLALAAWIFGDFVQRGRKRRGVALALVLLLLIGGYSYAIENQLQWRAPLPPDSETGSLKESPDGIDWKAWSPEAVAVARAAGRPVFVDFTADWCVTCQFNKKTSIEIKSVRAKLKEINAVSLLGDYTRVPDDITDELNRFERAGVPLVLVYPKNASEPPIVLPEALTPGIVLNALEKAAR